MLTGKLPSAIGGMNGLIWLMNASSSASAPRNPEWLARIIRQRRMDFLWVRWFGKKPEYISGSCGAQLPKVGFVESMDEFAFSFVDPAHVVRGCHLVPAFHEGRTVDLLPVLHSVSRCLNPDDNDDWVNFYVNM